MITYIRRQQHKTIKTPRHKTIRTTTEVSPWTDQLYILKTIKNATDIRVISTFQGHLVRFVYSEVSLPLARESFSEHCTQFSTSG